MASSSSNTSNNSTINLLPQPSPTTHDPLRNIPSYLPTFNPTSTPTPTPTCSSNSNSKKKRRPRASRRAPTTVLITDTSNFRAMVQEFTGIPASLPPFPSSLMHLSHHYHLITPPMCPSSSLLDHAIATRSYQFLTSSPLMNTSHDLNVQDNIAVPLQLGDLGRFVAAPDRGLDNIHGFDESDINVAQLQTDKRLKSSSMY